MKRTSYVLAFMVLAGTLLYTQRNSEEQGSVVALGAGRVGERASARILYSNRSTNTFPGQLAINYGQPVWRSEYEDPATFDQMTKGQVWRMGDNFWTVLDTNLPLKISGGDIAAGAYYLGVHRSQDGSAWSLAFIDPSKARRERLDASQIAQATIDFMVPMTFEKAEESTEKLTISLEKEDLTNLTLKVAWGNLRLTAPVQVMDVQ
ncbi:DUF2911 domain-containing protein [Acidobacteria bacterium AH-259-D05]|nr:DUF2911 domain-containing protein [Acidobacteria bacterium AH-259-D05]